jgi:hypothetical protein
VSRWGDWKGIGSYGTVGLEMVLSVLFGLFAGRWIGEKAGSASWGALIGFGFGVAAAARAMMRAYRQMQHQTATDGFRQSSTGRAARFELEERARARERGEVAPKPDEPEPPEERS